MLRTADRGIGQLPGLMHRARAVAALAAIALVLTGGSATAANRAPLRVLLRTIPHVLTRSADREMRLDREEQRALFDKRVEGMLDLAHKLFVGRCRRRRNERRER